MRRAFAFIATLTFVLIAVWLWKTTRPADRISEPPADGVIPPAAHTENGGASPSRSFKTVAATASTSSAEHSPLADALNSPRSDIRADLRIVSEIIDTFRSNFPRNGNPVGNNADITAALTGKNKLRLALIPPDHAAINKDGELCDRWGSPFFFHAESANRMEIRSAGPDKKMWTEDDVTFAP
jgi:hypothetical protein